MKTTQQIDYRSFRVHNTDGTCTECNLSQFRAANAADPELCIDLECLSVGWGFTTADGTEIYRAS